MTLAELNAASNEDFLVALGGIWEDSPWIVESVVRDRPVASLDALASAMAATVAAAGEELQLSLLRAHPDLAGKLAVQGGLTVESAGEQASAGLDRLKKREFESFLDWNARYRHLFGFPFIICVRENTKGSIRTAFRRRLGNSRSEELRVALDEVRKIAEYRLRDRVAP